MNSTSNLLDQYGGQSIGSQLLVNAEEVDLSHLHSMLFLLHDQVDWDARNEAHQLT